MTKHNKLSHLKIAGLAILFAMSTGIFYELIDAYYGEDESVEIPIVEDCQEDYKIKVIYEDGSLDTINLSSLLVKGEQPVIMFEQINPYAEWPCVTMRIQKIVHVLACDVKSFEFVDRVPIFKKPTRLKNE